MLTILIIGIFIGLLLAFFMAPMVIIRNKRILNKIEKAIDNFSTGATEQERKEFKRELISLKSKILADKKSSEKAGDLIASI